MLQWYGLSPECVLMWVVTEEDCENRRPQTLHVNGFSPECVRRWAVKLAAWEKDLQHMGHLKKFKKKSQNFTHIHISMLESWIP